MNNTKAKLLGNIAKLSRKMAISAEGKQSMFIAYEPKKPNKKLEN